MAGQHRNPKWRVSESLPKNANALRRDMTEAERSPHPSCPRAWDRSVVGDSRVGGSWPQYPNKRMHSA
jgi:hypothetical protein